VTSLTDDSDGTAAAARGSGPQRCALPNGLDLLSGKRIEHVDITYETWGELDDAGTNAVLVCHALTGDSHVATGIGADGVPTVGWWESMVGSGKAFDTDKYFVICSNVLGGCSGTTGPGSVDPSTGLPYGLTFPLVTIEDMVNAQAALLDSIGVRQLLAVVGGSMGGMQALAWARLHPERVRTCIGVASTPRLGAQAIGFNEVGRQAILADPNFRGGDYYGKSQPEKGLAIARMVGHITYLSDESMRAKFGRRLQDRDYHAFDFVAEFEVESYLAYQGRKLVERFDANTYLYMTKAMDYFDLAAGSSSLAEALEGARSRWLLLTFSSDWLFPTYQTKGLIDALRSISKQVSFAEIPSPYGHDAFLLEPDEQRRYIEPFLERALSEARRDAGMSRDGDEQ
jgi:homoserine O-acetyltransferase